MKKIQKAIICMISIFIIALSGTAAAYSTTYTNTCYLLSASPTIDGQYSSSDTWVSESASSAFGLNGVFRTGWTFSPSVYACFLVETWDNTSDTGDYWEICFDSTAAGGATEPNGGTHPQTDDFKLVVTGHTAPTVQWYVGNGTGWVPITPVGFSDVTVFQQAQSLSSSPMDASPHYIWEMHIDKTNTAGLGITAMGYDWAQYVAYYDAHAGGYGLQSWPQKAIANDTDPDSWGYIPYSMNAAPEGLSIGIVIALSSIAIVAGSVIFSALTLPKLAKKHSL